MHGAIIERGDKKPIHPRFGLYDFPAIQQAFADKDIVLISEQKKPRTVPKVYAEKVQNQVNLLINKGVPAKNIQSFKEIKTQTGKAHGTFFLPRDVWMPPVFVWMFREK